MPWLVLAFFAFVIVLLALEPDTLHAMLSMPIWFAIWLWPTAEKERLRSWQARPPPPDEKGLPGHALIAPFIPALN